jgi:hypothetical protein
MRLLNALVFALTATSIGLMGCEASPYPISEPGDVAINQAYLGTWTATDPDEGDVYTIELYAFNQFEYFGHYTSTDQEEEELALRVFESEVDGQRIANVQCFACDDDDLGFIFVVLKVTDNALVVRFVDDDIYKSLEDAQNPAEVEAYFRSHISDKDFLDDEAWEWHRPDSK